MPTVPMRIEPGTLRVLAALVSGIVIHRRIFREFFTFRPRKHVQRSVLDLHNLTGVVALPFHFFFALTGLTIFAGMYFPVSETMLKPQAQAAAMAEAKSKGLAFKPAGVQAPLASVDAMVVEAKRRWSARGIAMAIAAADNAVADNVIASFFFMVLLADGQMTVLLTAGSSQMNVLRHPAAGTPARPYTVQEWRMLR